MSPRRKPPRRGQRTLRACRPSRSADAPSGGVPGVLQLCWEEGIALADPNETIRPLLVILARLSRVRYESERQRLADEAREKLERVIAIGPVGSPSG
jgi:hypothetical protein